MKLAITRAAALSTCSGWHCHASPWGWGTRTHSSSVTSDGSAVSGGAGASLGAEDVAMGTARAGDMGTTGAGAPAGGPQPTDRTERTARATTGAHRAASGVVIGTAYRDAALAGMELKVLIVGTM